MLKKSTYLLILAVLAAGFVLVLQKSSLYDEGISAVASRRILQGEWPYKKFWLIYTPFQFFLHAGFLKISDSLMMLRLLDFLVKVLCVYTAVRIIRAERPGIPSYQQNLLAAGLLAVIFSSGIALYPIFLAVLLALAAYYFYRKERLWLCALLAVLSVFTKFEVGLFLVASLAITDLLRIPRKEISRKHTVSLLGKQLFVGIVAVLLLGWLCGFRNLYECLIDFPVNVYPAHRRLPLPHIDKFTSYVPLAILAIALALIYTAILSFDRRKKNDPLIVFMALFAGLMTYKFVVRSSYANVVMIIFLLCLFVVAIAKNAGWLKWIVASPVILLFFFSLYKLNFFVNRTLPDLRKYGYTEVCMNEPAENEIISFIRQHHNSSFYFGVKNHDRVAYNPVMFYFFVDRVMTYYQELHPGQVTTVDVQQQIVQELQTGKVEYVLLLNTEFNEPNQSSIDTHVELLDQYIREHYKEIQSFGPDYTLMQLK